MTDDDTTTTPTERPVRSVPTDRLPMGLLPPRPMTEAEAAERRRLIDQVAATGGMQPIVSAVMTPVAGWKTTEFWLKLAAILLTTLLASGAITNDRVLAVAGMAAAMLGALGYTVSRTQVKVATARASAISAASVTTASITTAAA